MAISLKTHKKLWGLAANRCAFPGCGKILTEDTENSEDYYAVGDEAHINSQKVNGPRHDPNLPKSEIDKYGNLILLCKIHHTKIDNDVKFYTTEKVKGLKLQHEKWVDENLKPDKKVQLEDELYSEYIDTIQELASFEKWHEWTERFQGSGSFPTIGKLQYENLVKLHKYLSGIIYPDSKEVLLNAILQFNLILEDFINEFSLFMADDGDGIYFTQQLYRNNVITVRRQEEHESILEELVIELTKAGNLLCKVVREYLYSRYRLSEGILLLYDYPIAGKAFRRFEYKAEEKYPGKSELLQKVRNYLN